MDLKRQKTEKLKNSYVVNPKSILSKKFVDFNIEKLF